MTVNFVFFRLMYDVSPNTQFNIMYELGAFWNDNADLQSLCGANLNATWWSNAKSDSMASFVSDRVVHSEYRFSSGTVMLMLSAVVMMALLSIYTVIMRQRNKVLKDDDVHIVIGQAEATDYGAV